MLTLRKSFYFRNQAIIIEHMKPLKSVLLLLMILWGQESLASFRIDGLYYNLNGDYAGVTVFNGVEECYGDIIIPNSVQYDGRNYEVKYIDDNSFNDCVGLTSIVIPETVDSIGFQAFAGCKKLKTIHLKNKKIKLGRDVFAGCESLPVYDNLRYADFILIGPFDKNFFSVMHLRGVSMSPSPHLSSYKIKNGTKIISPEAFSSCEELESIIIPSSVEVIGPDAFKNCTKLNKIMLPDSLKIIGIQAFKGCSSLESIRIPASVISIGKYNYPNFHVYGEEIPGLSNVMLRAEVGKSYDDPFSECNGLNRIEVADGNKIYDSRDNCNALIETASNTLLHGCKSTIIPETVKSIGPSAFEGCSGLFSISFPESITSIDDYAFRLCTNLKKIDLPSSIKSIGRAAFLGCDLNEMYIPKSVMQISYDSFLNRNDKFSISVAEGNQIYDSRNNCNAIIESSTNTLIFGCANTVIPSSVTSIGESAFSYCTALSTIEIPLSVTSIRESAFFACSGLTSIDIPSSVKTIASNAFGNCSNLKSVRLSESIETIGNAAFAGCSNIESISLPDSLSEIQAALFRGCVDMAEITIPESVKSIGSIAFDGCTKLKSVILPKNLEKIGAGAFANCSELVQMNIPENVNTIGSESFNGCKNLTSITLPDSITEISKNVFKGCAYLKSINLPNSVKTIESGAFNGCASIKQITIPVSVASIYVDAFEGCTDLKELYCLCRIPPQVLSFNYSSRLSFYNPILNFCTLFVPDSSLSQYRNAVGWNDFGKIQSVTNR
jgi:hypothetical protein